MSKFSAGNVVQLKPGGPKMTVALVLGQPETAKMVESAARQQGYQESDVSCIRFDGVEKKASFFQAAILGPVDIRG